MINHLNIALIGFGNVGRHYLDIFRKYKNIKKIFVVDLLRDKKKEKFCTFLTFKDLIKKKVIIDYAIICTPSGSHFEYAKYFLEKRVPTLIEKPFVISLKHAKELIKIKKRKNVKCWVAFQNRYNKSIIMGKKILEKNRFGKTFFVDAALYWHRDKKYYSSSWRGKYLSDGGVLFNQSIHLLDILIYFFGKVKNFNAVAGFSKKKLQAEDLISVNLNHKNKIISNLKATTRANRDYRMSLDILCEKGRFLIKGISLNQIFYFNKKHLNIDTKNSENFKLGLGPKSGMGNGHKKLLRDFFNNKIKKSNKSLDIENNLYVLNLIHSIYNSIFNKKSYQKIKNKEFKY